MSPRVCVSELLIENDARKRKIVSGGGEVSFNKYPADI
jgi:hypothetical protein